MAIWDVKETVVTESADSQKCLSCGENLTFVPREGVLKCNSCGATVFTDKNTMVEAIEPFDYSEMVPFNISYLQCI